MSLNVVDKLNALSGEIDSLLDFIASCISKSAVTA